jgi:hypothetical protein
MAVDQLGSTSLAKAYDVNPPTLATGRVRGSTEPTPSDVVGGGEDCDQGKLTSELELVTSLPVILHEERQSKTHTHITTQAHDSRVRH